MASEIVVEIGEPRLALCQRIGRRAFGCLLVEQRHEQPLVQFGADEGEPLLQPRARDAALRREVRVRKLVSDVLQDRGVLGEERAVVDADRRHHAERIDFEIIRAVGHDALGLRIDFDEAGVRAGLVERDARGKRTGEGREIKVHL